MKQIDICLVFGIVFGVVSGAAGQTRINLRVQGQNVDFTAAPSTKPIKTGSGMPASCGTGEMYLRLDAPAGQNLYACTATNTWTLQALESGASMASQLGDFLVKRTSSTTLTINSGCSTDTPCNYRLGGTVFAITAVAQASIVGGTGIGVAYIYISASGDLTVGYTAGFSVSCSTGCKVQSGVSGFPGDSVPLFLWRASSSGQWDSSGTDKRAFVAREAIVAGPGLIKSTHSTTGSIVLEIDPLLVTTRTAIPATSTTVCRTGQWANDGSYLYICAGTNVWRRTALTAW